MFDPQRRQLYFILIAGAIACVWLVMIVVLIVPIFRQLSPVVAAPVSTAQAQAVATPPGPPDSLAAATPTETGFPPTWTPTVSPTSTETATPVNTYPAWITWTPTATFTPKPPTPTPRMSEIRKKERIRLYRKHFRKVAKKYNLDWKLMIEQSYFESGLNPYALGKDYDMGLMQVIPATWRRVAPTVGVGVSDGFDPYSNILVGGAYLDQMRQECKALGVTDPGCMLLAYNWGPNNMRRLYANNYTWRQAPSKPRYYVYSILRAAGYE